MKVIGSVLGGIIACGVLYRLIMKIITSRKRTQQSDAVRESHRAWVQSINEIGNYKGDPSSQTMKDLAEKEKRMRQAWEENHRAYANTKKEESS